MLDNIQAYAEKVALWFDELFKIIMEFLSKIGVDLK